MQTVTKYYCNIIRIITSDCRIPWKGSPVWAFTIPIYLILPRGIKKHCKYDEVHWNISMLKELPLWKHSPPVVYFYLSFQKAPLPKPGSTHTHTCIVAIYTHTYKRKRKLLHFPFTGPIDRHERNVLTFLVTIPSYAPKDVLTVVFWLNSKLYSAYLKRYFQVKRLSFIPSPETHGTRWRRSGCSALPQKQLHFRGEGIIPFVRLLPVDAHSWGNQTLEMQAGKCFGTFQSRKQSLK